MWIDTKVLIPDKTPKNVEKAVKKIMALNPKSFERPSDWKTHHHSLDANYATLAHKNRQQVRVCIEEIHEI